ncbi:MAG: NAD-dependent epimerase/dehydratase family protein [Lachnospiraceae bacterium]|nr:NAD-dependent epimerase/dehydratase family protein [Lachnospiraceae bacterium]
MEKGIENTNVLVTGGTGFLAGWTIRRLLEKGYTVRTTVRSMAKSEKVTTMLAHENVDTSRLSFAVADLTSAKGWDEAMKGIDYVLHVASPLGGNNHEDPTLIPTAKSGVENVIGAAIRAGVKKLS